MPFQMSGARDRMAIALFVAIERPRHPGNRNAIAAHRDKPAITMPQPRQVRRASSDGEVLHVPDRIRKKRTIPSLPAHDQGDQDLLIQRNRSKPEPWFLMALP
ncbi:hypothetical protein C4552_02090 [Candidatus Parcubacteria bacterium]|nr:MAG: hypothetical protein C4552_02090 [Candidatus Parcubacteria bacterium]